MSLEWDGMVWTCEDVKELLEVFKSAGEREL